MADPVTPHEPGAVLATVRASLGLSLAGLAGRLRQTGGPALTRQRLSQLEQGHRDLSDNQWLRLAEALAAIGAPTTDTTLLSTVVTARDTAEPSPRDDITTRRHRLAVLAARLAENPRWRQFHTAAREHGVDLGQLHREASRRLTLATDHPARWHANADDAILVTEPERCSLHATSADPFLMRPQLQNAGQAHWQDRLLIRIGTSVSSSLPFTPGALLVPDTAPGETCEILIPGKAQWFPNLAVVSYLMIFPDGTPCLPGRLTLYIDTRDENNPDQTLPIPHGLTDRLRHKHPAIDQQ